MSEAATQIRSPRRSTAQSSPMGTSTSGGAGGSVPEIRRMISNSFIPRGATFAGRRGDGSARLPPHRERARRPRTRPPPPPRAPPRAQPSARSLAAGTVRAGSSNRVSQRLLPRPLRGPRDATGRWRVSPAVPDRPSRLQLPHCDPQGVKIPLRVPGRHTPPLLLGSPRVGVVGGTLGPHLVTRVAGHEAYTGVEFGVLGAPPGLDPGEPGYLGLRVEARLFECLAAGAGGEVLARLEHPTRVLPEPDRWLAAPEEERPRLIPFEVHEDCARAQVRVDHALVTAGLRHRGLWEEFLGEGAQGTGDAPDVLRAPPARLFEPLFEGHPPVAEVLVREVHLHVARAGDVGHGSEEVAARRLPDPGGEDALGRDEEACLLVELAHGPILEALAAAQTTGRRLPGAGRALEEQHAAVLPDGQDARDEVRLQHAPCAKTTRSNITRRVYLDHHPGNERCSQAVDSRSSASRVARTTTKQRPFDSFPRYHGVIRRGGHASTSRRLEKWRRGSVSGNATPICSVIASDSISSSARRRSQGWWWMSPR